MLEHTHVEILCEMTAWVNSNTRRGMVVVASIRKGAKHPEPRARDEQKGRSSFSQQRWDKRKAVQCFVAGVRWPNRSKTQQTCS